MELKCNEIEIKIEIKIGIKTKGKVQVEVKVEVKVAVKVYIQSEEIKLISIEVNKRNQYRNIEAFPQKIA